MKVNFLKSSQSKSNHYQGRHQVHCQLHNFLLPITIKRQLSTKEICLGVLKELRAWLWQDKLLVLQKQSCCYCPVETRTKELIQQEIQTVPQPLAIQKHMDGRNYKMTKNCQQLAAQLATFLPNPNHFDPADCNLILRLPAYYLHHYS